LRKRLVRYLKLTLRDYRGRNGTQSASYAIGHCTVSQMGQSRRRSLPVYPNKQTSRESECGARWL
jgi:hypothetical protein